MSVRTNIATLILATIAGHAAYAQGAPVFVGGEAGWIDPPVQSSLTREQVRSEFLQFRNNPVLPDGSRYVGGEAGYVLPQLTAPAPNAKSRASSSSPVRTPAEERQFRQDYPA